MGIDRTKRTARRKSVTAEICYVTNTTKRTFSAESAKSFSQLTSQVKADGPSPTGSALRDPKEAQFIYQIHLFDNSF